ncbi:hypothetical protein ACFPYI_15430 [Halomarina salina]|uniref:HIT-type domain-containing protein n=1 Tax=Halomarina salina TaxID=1872699 RepID=A0ABD5RQP3_9EURY|nr:hypothetical protein [Halomarina salina]
MSVSGLCELCSTNEIVDGCDRCGRLACEVHYDRETGLCTDCLKESGGTPDDEPERQPDGPDGVDTYQF